VGVTRVFAAAALLTLVCAALAWFGVGKREGSSTA
jgi:hypothetical protein